MSFLYSILIIKIICSILSLGLIPYQYGYDGFVNMEQLYLQVPCSCWAPMCYPCSLCIAFIVYEWLDYP